MSFFESFMLLINIFPMLPMCCFQMHASGSLNQKIENGFNMIPSFFIFVMKIFWDLIVTLEKRTFGYLTCLKFIIDYLPIPNMRVCSTIFGFSKIHVMLSHCQYDTITEGMYSLHKEIPSSVCQIFLREILKFFNYVT